jgi:tyrosine-protein kinase Etk/Wzc
MKSAARYDDEFDLLRFVGVFFKYIRLILIITGIISLGGLLFLFLSSILPSEISFLPDMYKPVAVVLVNERTSGDIISSLLASLPFQGQSTFGGGAATNFSYGKLAEKLISSNSIIDIIAEEFQMVQRYGITRFKKGDTRKTIMKHLSVHYDEETMLITIGYEDYDPEFAKRVVNRFVELLDKRFLSIGGNRIIMQKQLLETKITEVKAEIAVLEGQIQEFQKKYGVLDIESLAMEQVTMMARFRSQLMLKEMEIKTYSDFSRIEDPVIKRLKVERDNLLNLIGEMESGFSEYLEVLPSQKDLPTIAQTFYHLERDLSVQEKIYEILVQQYEVIKLSLEGIPMFQVLEIADIPDMKIGPHRILFFVVISISGFFLSVIIAFILNTIERIKSDPERLKRIKGE